MRKVISIIIGLVVFGGIFTGLMFALFGEKDSGGLPNIEQQIYFASTTATLTPVQQEEIKAQIIGEFHQNVPDSSDVVLSHTVIVEPYALADWTDENTGGQVIMKYETGRGWVIVLIDGGVFGEADLTAVGVPSSIASELVRQIQRFY